MSPLPFTVNVGTEDEVPNEPVFAFTVASVAGTFPGPVAVTSPVKPVIVFGEAIVIMLPAGVMVMFVPGARIIAPVRVFILLTPGTELATTSTFIAC